MPIGRPIANIQLYVLDAQLQPLPIGVPGELFIGGVGLARGYLARPDLTAERFVPNPFAEVSGIGYRVLGAEPSDTRYPAPATRLYKTGDRVRYRPDGAIEYLGRLDNQVKLRGFRIELGEIEMLLRQHAGVRECIVVARADVPGDQRLVAYVVPVNADRTDRIYPVPTSDGRTDRIYPVPTSDGCADPSIVHRLSSFVQELRDHLQQRLPDYMLPSAFVLLDALPLLPNGKVDRRGLPAPDGDRARAGPRLRRAAHAAGATPGRHVAGAAGRRCRGVR